MRKEAEEHAEEDKKRREEADLVNEAEQLVFQTEKSIKDLGDNTYKAAFDVQQITIIKKTCSISASAKSFKAKSKNKLYTITLKSDKCSSIDGKPYMGSGKQVTLKVNKKSYVAKTNKKGQATFSININKKGTYTAKITYAGNVMYSGAQKNVKIKII